MKGLSLDSEPLKNSKEAPFMSVEPSLPQLHERLKMAFSSGYREVTNSKTGKDRPALLEIQLIIIRYIYQ